MKINFLGALDQLSLTWLWLAYCCLYSCLTLIGNSLKELLRSVLSLKPRISQKISPDKSGISLIHRETWLRLSTILLSRLWLNSA